MFRCHSICLPYELEMRSDLQVAQLSQSCEVVPFGPRLKDLPIPNTINCNAFGIQGLAAGQVRTHRTVLNSTEMVPHGKLFALSKSVEDYFLRVRKCLIFAAKIPHEGRAASDGGGYRWQYCAAQSPVRLVNQA
jgi:hypothetical protein